MKPIHQYSTLSLIAWGYKFDTEYEQELTLKITVYHAESMYYIMRY